METTLKRLKQYQIQQIQQAPCTKRHCATVPPRHYQYTPSVINRLNDWPEEQSTSTSGQWVYIAMLTD